MQDVGTYLNPIFCVFQEAKSKGNVVDFRPNILMLGNSPSDYVLRAVSSVRTNDLEQSLLVSLVDMSSASTILYVQQHKG